MASRQPYTYENDNDQRELNTPTPIMEQDQSHQPQQEQEQDHQPQSLRWVNFPGASLIKNVEMTVGGDDVKRWRCNECGHPYTIEDAKEIKDPNGSQCGHTKKIISYDKFREVYKSMYDTDITEDEMYEIPDEIFSAMITEEVEIDQVCASTAFTFRKEKGYVLHRYDAATADFWREFQTADSKAFQNMINDYH